MYTGWQRRLVSSGLSVSMTLRRQGSALRIHRHRWYKLFVKKRKDGGLRRALAFAAR